MVQLSPKPLIIKLPQSVIFPWEEEKLRLKVFCCFISWHSHVFSCSVFGRRLFQYPYFFQTDVLIKLKMKHLFPLDFMEIIQTRWYVSVLCPVYELHTFFITGWRENSAFKKRCDSILIFSLLVTFIKP